MNTYDEDNPEYQPLGSNYAKQVAKDLNKAKGGFIPLYYRHACKTKKQNGHVVRYLDDGLICCRNCKYAWESVRYMVEDSLTYEGK